MHLKLELFEFRDVHFHTKERNWSSTDFAMFSYKTRIGDRSSSSITSDLLDFHTNKTEKYWQRNFLCLDETSRVACKLQFSRNSNLQKCYYFLVAMNTRAKSW